MSTLYSNKTLFGLKNDASRYAWVGYDLMLLLSTTIGNIIVLIASIKYKAFKLQKSIMIITQHVAISDILWMFTYQVPQSLALVAEEWVLGDTMCSTVPHVMNYCGIVSMYLICTMTTCKAITLKFPLRSRARSTKSAHKLCAIAWALALNLPVTQVLLKIVGEGYTTFSYIRYECVYVSHHWLYLVMCGISLMIPNIMVVAATTYLLYKASKAARRSRNTVRWQGIMTTLLVAGVYCLSILPNGVLVLKELILDEHNPAQGSATEYRLADWVLLLNPFSNFYIYILTVRSFRNFLRSRVQHIKSSIREDTTQSHTIERRGCSGRTDLTNEH